MSCGTALEARRNSDERWTFTPSSRNYTFSGMAPLFTVRRGETVLLQIDQTQTVNGSLFSVVGDSVVLQLKKGDAALLDGPTPDTDAEALFYDVTLTDQTGFENWIIGGPFTLLGLNDVSCGGCNEKVEVTIGGQCIQINIEGGNLGIGASVNLAALNQAVQDAETAAGEAAQSASEAATAGAAAGAASGAAAGSAAGATSGAVAGELAAELVVADKVDLDAGNILDWDQFKSGARITVPTKSSVASLPAGGARSVFVESRASIGDGYAGVFEWTSGDQSASVSIDSTEAIWIAPSSDPTGSSGAWKRSFSGSADAAWFGASESSDSVSALSAMAALLGYINVFSPVKIGSNTTIDNPLNFGPNGYFDIQAGATVTLVNTMNAGSQWVFRGDGNVVIPLPDTDSGEDIRQIRAIWFGAFTQAPTNQAPAIQKAINALGNSREGVILFDCGSYDIESGMTVGRGVKLKGVGTRRTVFQVKNDGYPVFQTSHTACFFEDIQCENSPVSLTREYPFIHLKHDFCEVTNFFHQSAKNAIIMDGTNCKARNVEGVYGTSDPGPGSSQILIRAAGCSAEGIYSRFSSGMGPTAIIEIGTGAAGAVTAFYVRNVEYVWGSIGVLIHGDNVSVARGMIRDVNYRGSPGNQSAPQVVKIKTSGSGSVFGVSINGLIISNQAVEGVTFEQGSTGSISRILIDDVYDAATTGSCIHFAQTAGTIRDIFIGANVRTDRANDITESIGTVGGVAGVRVAIPGRRKGKTADFTVPYSGIDDGVTYHIQSASSLTATLPNNVDGASVVSFNLASSNGASLSAQAGSTINGASTLSVPASRLITVEMTRNVGGTSSQWYTNL